MSIPPANVGEVLERERIAKQLAEFRARADANAWRNWQILLANPTCRRHPERMTASVVNGKAVCKQCADKHHERTRPKVRYEPESKRSAELRAEMEAKQRKQQPLHGGTNPCPQS